VTPPSRVLTPLAGPYPGFVRVDHPNPNATGGPTLPNGIQADVAARHMEARLRDWDAKHPSTSSTSTPVNSGEVDAEVVASNESSDSSTPSRRTRSSTSDEDISNDDSAADESTSDSDSPSITVTRPDPHIGWKTPGDKFAICVLQGRQFKVMV
jgi:hypothetical protein